MKLTKQQLNYLESFVETYKDFPIEGIDFKDLSLLYTDLIATSIIQNFFESAFNSKWYLGKLPECVIGCDARGFILGTLISQTLQIPLVLARKPGKLPGELLRQSYGLEYGNAELQIHKHIIEQYNSAIIADDVLATGGTCLAVSKMLNSIGISDISYAFIMEIEGLDGRGKLCDSYGRELNNQIFSVLKG